jgi:homospermidine synthase
MWHKINSLKKPIRIYQNEENNYDVVMNQGAVSYVSKKKVVDNFDDIVEPSLNNKKRERVEIDLDFDESEAQLQDFLDSPEKKKNVSPKKSNKKVC